MSRRLPDPQPFTFKSYSKTSQPLLQMGTDAPIALGVNRSPTKPSNQDRMAPMPAAQQDQEVKRLKPDNDVETGGGDDQRQRQRRRVVLEDEDDEESDEEEGKDNSSSTQRQRQNTQSGTESEVMDEEDETQLVMTIEYISQLPKPKPHSMFYVKSLDKKKTVLVLPSNISLIGGQLYNMAAKPPAPVSLQLLRPPSNHRLSFDDTPAHLVRLLKSSKADQHAQLGFKTPSCGSMSRAENVMRFGGERLYLAAKSWENHTVNRSDALSAVRMLGHLLRHDDHDLCTIICKSFQPEWTVLVQGDTFVCGGGCGQARRFDESGYTFELVLERAMVAAVARQALENGIRVSGYKVLQLLASPANGNVVLSCQHCPNVCKGKITSAQQAAILAKIRL